MEARHQEYHKSCRVGNLATQNTSKAGDHLTNFRANTLKRLKMAKIISNYFKNGYKNCNNY